MKTIQHNHKAKNLLYTLGGLAGISLIILIHETGHFLFAKFFGVPTPYFSLGFGPSLYELPIGQTIFKIALLPFGGYVEMDPETLNKLSYLPKMLIVFAGILFNLIFAYAILLYYALSDQTTLTPIIGTITPDSPAEHADLQPNDVIIACNDQLIGANAHLITEIIATYPQQTIVLTIERNGKKEEITIPLTSEHPLFGPHVGWLGITLQTTKTSTNSVVKALHKGHAQFTSTTQEMGNAVSKMMTGKKQQSMIMGPIGIINMIGKSLTINPQMYWFILAILSLNMGLFNILPLPFFDGGKALIYTVEAITGTTIPATALWFISTIFLVLFVLFITRVTVNDIRKLFKT